MDNIRNNLQKRVEEIVDQRTDWFETLVMAAAMNDLEFYTGWAKALCRSSAGEPEQDFTGDMRNAAYEAVAYYNDMFLRTGRPFSPITDQVAGPLLQGFAASGKFVMPEEVPSALLQLAMARAVDHGKTAAMVEMGMPYWLEKRKMERKLRTKMMVGGWTPGNIYDITEEIRRNVSAQGAKCAERSWFGMSTMHPPEAASYARISSGLKRLDHALGGGFVYGDSYLLIAPPGGGKTIFACQVAMAMALSDAKGILITTEQPPWQLEQRIVSNWCSIPIGTVTAPEFNLDKIPPDIAEQVHGLATGLLSKNLRFVDWTKGDFRVVEDLHAEVRQFIADTGHRPNFIILDWIGGALQEQAKGDKDELRRLYKLAADTVVEAGVRYGCVAIAMAQATPGSSLNKCPIDISHIADAKNMAEKMATLIGLTALYTPGMDWQALNGEEPPFAEKQFLCVSRIRKGPGGMIPVRRKYQYQRLENW